MRWLRASKKVRLNAPADNPSAIAWWQKNAIVNEKELDSLEAPSWNATTTLHNGSSPTLSSICR